jgi:hypothetical protein
MLSKKRFTIMSAFLAIMLCISLASVNSALADDGTPTEPAAATERSVKLELLPVETDSINLSAASQDEFAVLYGDAKGIKIEISQQINSDNLYKIMTTEKTGIFVLVKK